MPDIVLGKINKERVLPKGVFAARDKKGSEIYRSSITYRSKHISLGTRKSPEEAEKLYTEAQRLLKDGSVTLADYEAASPLPHDKWVVLLNYRINGIYFHNPIFLHKSYFSYHVRNGLELKFDTDDLFFYSEHRIQIRGGHLFCESYGIQISIKSRYGIKPYAVEGRDYRFLNGDNLDYRYHNIEVINHYQGVKRVQKGYHQVYAASIHIDGIYNLGRYEDEETAAIAYNKARDLLEKKGIKNTGLPANFIIDMPASRYAEIYAGLKLPARFLKYVESLGR